MNTKLLRQKVLDLAIHGKLLDKAVVEALETTPGYEPASKLLERIRGESLPLATAGKPSSASPSPRGKAPKTPATPITEDEIPFEIPENWCWCRLGDLIQIKSGDSIKVRDNQTGEFPVYGGNGITGYYFDFNIEFPTIVIGRVGFNCGSVHLTKDKSWVTDNAFITTFDKRTFNIIFLTYLLKYLNLCNYSNSTAQPVISGKTIYPIPIPLPPLEEQKLIVEEIERIFALIDTVEQNKTDLETVIKQTKSKILDLAIHGKLVPQDKTDEPASKMLEKLRAEKEEKIAKGQLKRDKNDSYIYKSANGKWLERKADGSEEVEVPFEIPESWSWSRLGELGYTNIGLTYHPEDITDNGVPVLRSCNIKNDSLDFEDTVRVNTKILSNQYVQEGDILICARNGSQSLVGKCTIISDLQEPMSFGAFMAIFRSEMNPYILKYLQSFYFKDYMLNANSTQICQLTQAMLKNALIPVPPREEQKRIVSKIEELSTYLDTITKSIG